MIPTLLLPYKFSEYPDITEYIRKYQTERGRSIKVTVFGDGEDITASFLSQVDVILQITPV